MSPVEHDVRELKELVATSGQILNKLDLVDYLGHVSARTADGNIVVKPKHSPTIRGMDKLTAEQMIVVDMDGVLIEGENAPPAEIFIHTEIYKARLDVNAIVHTHQHSATIMGIIGEPFAPLLHLTTLFVGENEPAMWQCPLLVSDSTFGAQLAQALGGNSFCHLQGHGIVAVAASVQEATVGAVMLEDLAKANLAVLATGRTPRSITAEERAGLKKFSAPVHGRWAYLKELLEP